MVVIGYTSYVGRHEDKTIVQGVSHVRRIISVLSTWRPEFDPSGQSVGIIVVKFHCDRVLFEIPVLPCHRHSTNAPYTNIIKLQLMLHNLCNWQIMQWWLSVQLSL